MSDQDGKPGVDAECRPDGEGDRSAVPEAELEHLRQQLREKEEETRAYEDKFLRERAELENFKKRMQREKADAIRFACEPMVRELLPVIDNLERALEHSSGQSVAEGVRLVLRSMLEILDRHGVTRLEALGKPFDPAHHEALAQVESSEYGPNQVVEQHSSGYLLHERLLRPALVTVSKPKASAVVESGAESG